MLSILIGPYRNQGLSTRTVVRALLWVVALVGVAGCATAPEAVREPETEVVGSGAPAAGGPSGTKVEDMLARADQKLAKSNLNEALDLYLRVLSEQPKNPRALIGAGEIHLERRDAGTAYSYFQRAESFEPHLASALEGQGLALCLEGNWLEALSRLEKAVKGDPQLWRSWNVMGVAYDRLGKWKQADRSYNRALALSPTPAAVLNNMGMSLILRQRYHEAAELFERAMSFEPDSRVIRSNWRLAVAGQGRYDSAVANLQSDEKATAFNNVGVVAAMRGDNRTAEQLFEKAMRSSPSFYFKASKNLEELTQSAEHQEAP